MISDLSAAIFVGALVAILVFIVWNIRTPRKLQLINKLYLAIAVLYAVWVLALLLIRFTRPEQRGLLFIWDAITNSVGTFLPPLYLCIALSFVKGGGQLPRWHRYLFIIPVISNIVIWTNPIHHLQYQVFSVVKSEIVFGPYVVVSGLYCYLCLASGIGLMIRFALKNRVGLYIKQCVLFALGGLCPLAVGILATISENMPITSTPISFISTIVCNGIAIYQLHLLDIQPLATQQVLDWISDCYLVLSDKGLVISYNRPFAEVFASRYGIAENRFLRDCVKKEDVSHKTAVYHLITAVESCRQAQSVISYEQAVTVHKDGAAQKYYYITDVSPLMVHNELSGFVAIFKDVTQLKKSMQQLSESQASMMEQERLASVGQMIGGVAHNLKTPIMSISGCISAAEALIEECEDSLDDPQVEKDDYREIYGEIRTWFDKVRESTAYMSDIITAIKGQATNAALTQEATFPLDELIKRAQLLMRHELFSGNCRLITEFGPWKEVTLHGDINNLVQVLNNLISNAIDAQKQVGGGDIVIGAKRDEESFQIYVKDSGPGVSPGVRRKLFKEMVTSKGTHGTGLGLYISNAMIRGKFGGSMWVEDNPDGGAIFTISIPSRLVAITNAEEKKGGDTNETE